MSSPVLGAIHLLSQIDEAPWFHLHAPDLIRQRVSHVHDALVRSMMPSADLPSREDVALRVLPALASMMTSRPAGGNQSYHSSITGAETAFRWADAFLEEAKRTSE